MNSENLKEFKNWKPFELRFVKNQKKNYQKISIENMMKSQKFQKINKVY